MESRVCSWGLSMILWWHQQFLMVEPTGAAASQQKETCQAGPGCQPRPGPPPQLVCDKRIISVEEHVLPHAGCSNCTEQSEHQWQAAAPGECEGVILQSFPFCSSWSAQETLLEIDLWIVQYKHIAALLMSVKVKHFLIECNIYFLQCATLVLYYYSLLLISSHPQSKLFWVYRRAKLTQAFILRSLTNVFWKHHWLTGSY